MSSEPRYLVQNRHGRLFGYWTEQALRIDLAQWPHDFVKLWRLSVGTPGTVSYEEISPADVARSA